MRTETDATDETAADYLEHALEDLTQARQQAQEETRAVIESAVERTREALRDLKGAAGERAKKLRTMHQDQTLEWQGRLQYASDNVLLEIGIEAVRAQRTSLALNAMAEEIKRCRRTAVGRLSGLRLIFRTEWSATEGVYGLILALSVIAVAREYDSSPDAGLVGLSVLITAVVFYVAHVSSDRPGRGVSQGQELTPGAVGHAMRDHFSLERSPLLSWQCWAPARWSGFPTERRFSRPSASRSRNWPPPGVTQRSGGGPDRVGPSSPQQSQPGSVRSSCC